MILSYTLFWTFLGIIAGASLFLFYCTNIKLQKLQDKIKYQQSDYDCLINNMPIIYIRIKTILDKSGIISDIIYLNANNYFFSFLGSPNILGRKGSEIFPENFDEILNHIRKASVNPEKSEHFTYSYKPRKAIFNIFITPTRHSGIWDVFCTDNTSLIEISEQLNFTNRMLETAVDIANIIPWRWNLKEQIIQYEMADPFGQHSPYSLQNRTIKEVSEADYFSLIHPDDQTKIRDSVRDLITGKTVRMKEEYRKILKTPDNKREEWIQLHAIIDKNKGDNKDFVLIGSALIITPFKRLEEELIKSRLLVEESNRLKSAFLANISHEIRTPLNAIVGFSDLLITEEDPEAKQTYTNIIKANNEQLLNLVRDVLDLAKIEAGKLEFVDSVFDLNPLMLELETTMRLQLKTKNIALQIEIPPISCRLRSERNRLAQALTNLLNNSIKFTTEGYIRFGYYPERQKLHFFVKDTGCGIPPDQLDHIFDRFTKLNPFKQGTGLGLSICNNIIRQMGGDIGVESKLGEGTHFWFTLPYVKA